MSLTLLTAALVTLTIVAAAVSFFIGRSIGSKGEVARQALAKATAEETARRILGDAEREAESSRKGAVLAGKEEVMRLREAFEQDARGRRVEIEAEEKRLQEKDTVLDRKLDLLEQRDRDFNRRVTEVAKREKATAEREQELDRLVAEQRHRLEQLAGMTAQDAKAELLRRMEEEAQADAANRIREIRETARRNADREAKKIVALAIQRI
ncbi:MAG TPA: Rnase Y domain-containing protein, partial [Gemmatimonadaceae bacterium]|nr:Rnase Y domain-containing protein [Gemmatimonadaceae bacterium]